MENPHSFRETIKIKSEFQFQFKDAVKTLFSLLCHVGFWYIRSRYNPNLTHKFEF